MIKIKVFWEWRQLIFYCILLIITKNICLSGFLNTSCKICRFLGLYWCHLSTIFFGIQSISKWILPQLFHGVSRNLDSLIVSTVLFSLFDWCKMRSIKVLPVRRLVPLMLLLLKIIYFLDWKFILMLFYFFICDLY